MRSRATRPSKHEFAVETNKKFPVPSPERSRSRARWCHLQLRRSTRGLSRTEPISDVHGTSTAMRHCQARRGQSEKEKSSCSRPIPAVALCWRSYSPAILNIFHVLDNFKLAFLRQRRAWLPREMESRRHWRSVLLGAFPIAIRTSSELWAYRCRILICTRRFKDSFGMSRREEHESPNRTASSGDLHQRPPARINGTFWHFSWRKLVLASLILVALSCGDLFTVGNTIETGKA